MWLQTTATVNEADVEPLSDAFSALGAVSVSCEDAGDKPLFEPLPGETPLWAKTKVIALFEGGADGDVLKAAVEARLGAPLANWQAEALEDRAWEREWLTYFQPMRFGRRLWVCPSDMAPPEPDAVNVWLDPGLAFGTGTHPTTALCLEWLDGLDLAGKTVFDYGCGSGILAVAALRLGAERAYGLDIDPQALTASADNAAKNGVAESLKLYPAGAGELPQADVVVANILAGPLAELADVITGLVRPGGRLALSGILESQAGAVRDAYAGRVAFDPLQLRAEWVLLSGTIKPHSRLLCG